MPALVFESVKIFSDSGYSTLVGEIKNVLTDDITMDKEGNIVTVDNGRDIAESYSGNFEIRTRNASYEASAGGTADGEDILGGANSPVSTDGTLPTESYVALVGRSNSKDVQIGAAYINGMEDFSNGRTEVMLTFSLTEVDQGDVASSAAATGS